MLAKQKKKPSTHLAQIHNTDKETHNKYSINISLMTRDPSRPTSNNEQLRYSPDNYLWDYTQTFLSTHSGVM